MPTALEVLQLIEGKIASCRKCDGLCEYREKNGYKTVPGSGAYKSPRLMVIGEAPGQREAESGYPFVGPAGRLLDRLLGDVGIDRTEEVFVANILKCRPPSNRDPLPEEAKECFPYLKLQIEVVRPPAILCLGRIASAHFFGNPEDFPPLHSFRGKVHSYCGIPSVCTFHPSYLLRQPGECDSFRGDVRMLLETVSRGCHPPR